MDTAEFNQKLYDFLAENLSIEIKIDHDYYGSSSTVVKLLLRNLETEKWEVISEGYDA